jgi:hypothetical protein
LQAQIEQQTVSDQELIHPPVHDENGKVPPLYICMGFTDETKGEYNALLVCTSLASSPHSLSTKLQLQTSIRCIIAAELDTSIKYSKQPKAELFNCIMLVNLSIYFVV